MTENTAAYITGPLPVGYCLLLKEGSSCTGLYLAHDKTQLESSLTALPRAVCHQPHDPQLMDWLSQLQQALQDGDFQPHIPLAPAGSPFQLQVWSMLRTIPRGRTLTYGDIARGLGKPGAARAVGQACGANPIALLIPCHRVIQASGRTGGYRWGLDIKQALLALELAQSASFSPEGGDSSRRV